MSEFQMQVAQKITEMIHDRMETEGCDGRGTLSFDDVIRLGQDIAKTFVNEDAD